MKYVITLMMLVLLAACGRPSVPCLTHADMAKILKNRTVALVSEKHEGRVSAYCSGTWIERDRILTANHCVDGKSFVHYTVELDVFAKGEHHKRQNIVKRVANVTSRDADHDLAILTPAGTVPIHGTAPIFLGEITQGQSAQCLGHPLGMWFSYSSGEVAAIRVQESVGGFDMLFVQAAVAISPGSSGGALFDENGSILGIAHGSYDEGQMVNLFIHAKYALELAK